MPSPRAPGTPTGAMGSMTCRWENTHCHYDAGAAPTRLARTAAAAAAWSQEVDSSALESTWRGPMTRSPWIGPQSPWVEPSRASRSDRALASAALAPANRRVGCPQRRRALKRECCLPSGRSAGGVGWSGTQSGLGGPGLRAAGLRQALPGRWTEGAPRPPGAFAAEEVARPARRPAGRDRPPCRPAPPRPQRRPPLLSLHRALGLPGQVWGSGGPRERRAEGG